MSDVSSTLTESSLHAYLKPTSSKSSSAQQRTTDIGQLTQLENNFFFFFQAEDGIRDHCVTGVQTCALPICPGFEPRITAAGIFVPTSLPAETSMNPVTACPATAVAVPTVSVGCCAMATTNGTQLRRINASRLRILASSRPRLRVGRV